MMVPVIAYGQPPDNWGFSLSKSKLSWWIRIEAQRVPRCLSALKARGIKAIAIWAQEPAKNPPPSPFLAKGRRDEERPRGKAARAAYAQKRQQATDGKYLETAAAKTSAIQEALAIEDAKRQRLKREASKRKAELASQRRRLAEREQQLHASAVAAMLAHPVGNA